MTSERSTHSTLIIALLSENPKIGHVIDILFQDGFCVIVSSRAVRDLIDYVFAWFTINEKVAKL